MNAIITVVDAEGNAISGAKLIVKDAEGNVVETISSEDTAAVFFCFGFFRILQQGKTQK